MSDEMLIARARRLRVVVVVLGDLGRSPRMLYHALALADSIADVTLVGYVETEIERAVAEHAHITIHRLRLPRALPRALFLVCGLVRVLRQSLELLVTLGWRIPRPDVLLVQNPPAVPTLLVSVLVARARGLRLVIDWHNFGWAMLALRLGPSHPVVHLARCYERVLGRRGDAHLCVSRALGAELAARGGIGHAVVLYDRPARRFVPAPAAVRQALRAGLAERLRLPPLSQAPALVVAPTSWTADEDFDLLLEAARRCDQTITRASGPFPDIVIVATGMGPLRPQYEERMRALVLRRVHLRTLWLSAEDYPPFLGSADLGLCLHRSASGLDLPMKVADLLGAGLPVCALDYGPTLREILRPDQNGLLFSSAADLAAQLEALFRGFPDDAPLLERLRQNVQQSRAECWTDGWSAVARPLFERGRLR
jgi:beta-1,4-mannosyltransferase